jgi:hypothetical protein
MRKALLLLGGLLPLTAVFSQEPADALKFSWNVPGASARIQAVGGAMGSLGGDITALFVNPAGLAFYRTGDLVISPNIQAGRTKGSFLGETDRRVHDRFTLGATGVVLGGGSTRANRNTAFSIGMNRMADFNNSFTYRGRNNQSSYSQKYLEEIGNTRDGNVVAGNFPFGASLGFNTMWIDTVGGQTNGNFQFQSRSLPLLSSGLLQQNTVDTRGGITELAIGGAVQTSEKLMFGGSIGVPFVHYKRESVFIEADPSSNPNNRFDFASVTEELQTTGMGINLKAGMIFKPQEFWRVGLAVHSPTFFTLTDQSSVTVRANTENNQGILVISDADITGASQEFKYSFNNPYRIMGSISYVIREIQDVTRQRGFITADVEYVNHTASSFSPDGETGADPSTKQYLKLVNNAIDNAYKGAFNFRLGGELKFTTIMFRAGAAFFGNPYKDVAGEYGQRVNLSGGLGYRNKGFFIDLTYVHAMTKDANFAYRLQNGPNNIARLNNTTGNIFSTVGFKF